MENKFKVVDLYSKSFNKEQREKLTEMVKWIYPDYYVNIQDGNFVVTNSDNPAVRTYSYPTFIELLLFTIPKKLGMDFVIVDPEDYNSLFNQVSEKYDIYINISESAEAVPKKTKYENSYEENGEEMFYHY